MKNGSSGRGKGGGADQVPGLRRKRKEQVGAGFLEARYRGRNTIYRGKRETGTADTMYRREEEMAEGNHSPSCPASGN